MDVKSAHLIGGFAQVKWFTSEEILCKNFSNFKDSEENIISHMNSCHKTSIKMYINNLMQNEISSNKEKETGISLESIRMVLILEKKKTLLVSFLKKKFLTQKN